MGESIEFLGNGSTTQGYLSKPESGSGPGVIVIQEWWGLVGHIKDVADRFVSAGYVALAPDFYNGKQTDEPDEAGSLMMALDIDNAAKVIKGAVDFLAEHPAVNGGKVGVVGFCMGGQLALFAAGLDERIAACANFYGIHPNVEPDFGAMKAEVLGLFAERDDYADPASVKALDQRLTAHGVRHAFKTFEDTDHAFFNDDRPEVYKESAAKEAWELTLKLFSRNLK